MLLDKAAAEYAKLLADPCNAPLTRGVYSATAGSLVSRFEADFILNAGPTEVASIFAFAPGTGTCYGNAVPLTADTTASSLQFAGGTVPGGAFLSATAGTVRALAACMQVSFPGTELNRSGIIGMGVVPGGTITPALVAGSGGPGGTTTAAAIRQLCQHTERMPQNMAEVLWMPGDGDALTIASTKINAAATSNAPDLEDRNLLLMSASGFPVSTGIRIRLVVVYEWSPRIAQGIVATVEPSRSSFSVNDVVRALHLRDPHWYVNAYKKTVSAAKTVGSVISYGAKVLGNFV